MTVRPALALLVLAAPMVALLGPSAASAAPSSSPCASTKIMSVTTSSPSVNVGTKKTRSLDVYVAVRGACSSSTVTVTLSSPGKTRSFTADLENRLKGWGLNGAAVDVTYYTVGIDLEPKRLQASDAGTWHTSAELTTELGATTTKGPDVLVRHATRTTFDASPEPVREGKQVNLVGRLSQADWSTQKYVPRPHDELTLQWRPHGGAFQDLTPLAVDDGAYWGSSFTMTRSGCFRGAYAGDATTAPVTSRTDCVKVR